MLLFWGMNKRLLPLILFAIAVTSLCSVQPAQAFTVTLQQVGSNVVATGSGAFDLMGLTLDSSGYSANAGMLAATADISVAAGGPLDRYLGFTGPSSIGPGGLIVADSNSGDSVTIIGSAASFIGLFLPVGYVSGTLLSDTSTYNNQTFASLGV